MPEHLRLAPRKETLGLIGKPVEDFGAPPAADPGPHPLHEPLLLQRGQVLTDGFDVQAGSLREFDDPGGPVPFQGPEKLAPARSQPGLVRKPAGHRAAVRRARQRRGG